MYSDTDACTVEISRWRQSQFSAARPHRVAAAVVGPRVTASCLQEVSAHTWLQHGETDIPSRFTPERLIARDSEVRLAREVRERSNFHVMALLYCPRCDRR